MDSPDTVTEATRQLAAEGYETSVLLRDGELQFGDPERCCPIDQAVVERMFRFEGDSDPGDQMVVFGIRDAASGLRGTLVSGFGLAADPEVFDHVRYLADQVDQV